MKEEENNMKQEWEKPAIISLDIKMTKDGEDPEASESFDGTLS